MGIQVANEQAVTEWKARKTSQPGQKAVVRAEVNMIRSAWFAPLSLMLRGLPLVPCGAVLQVVSAGLFTPQQAS